MKKYCLSIFSTFLFFNFISFAQKTKWTGGSFDRKIFIENKGQFDGKDNLEKSTALYAYINNGFEIYFTSHGLTYRHDEIEKISGREKEGTENKKEEFIPKITPHFVHVEWQGANPDPKIIAEDQLAYYFTYPDEKDVSGKTSLKANGFKKITYKNIYPGIDIEYFFPEDKEGLKYSIILHPGADASLIKMRYSGELSSMLDSSGNILMHSSFGDITDHAPLSFYFGSDSKKINSAFNLKNNIASFSLGNYDHSQTIIIDPWTTNPNYPTYNAAYDVEYDFAGNVYTYGGAPPYQEIKYNNLGAIQWVYTASLFTVAGYYADFCVDGTSGSSYVFEAYRCCNQGTRIAKVNSAGAQVGMFAGNPQMQEFWRATFNNCTRKAIAVGSSFVNPAYFQACIVDTTMASITPSNVLNVNSLSSGNDMCLLAMDNSNNCFMANCGNQILKTPANTLTPTNYLLPNNHSFTELNSIAYVKNSVPSAIGMNGMAVSNTYLYTYDGKLLQRWKKSNGAFMNSTTISATSFRWGGIAVDECDNIFVGKHSSVIQYDTLFNVVTTIPMTTTTDTVYDVRLAPGNLLYVCGLGFVSSIQLNLPVCNPLNLAMSSSGSCSSTGSATVVATGGTGPYTYSWNPSGQTTSTATGLPSGTYTVTVIDASCIPKIQTATVVVTNSGSLTVTASQNNLQCSTSTNGSATVVVSGGQSPYTYSWTPSGGSNANATGLSPGTYTCIITDASGCSTTQVFTITSPTALTLTVAPTSSVCNNLNGSAIATAGGGTGPYTYSWNNSQTNATATGLGAGTFTIYITDANGCTSSQTVIVTSNNPLTLTVSSTQTSCIGTNGTANANPANGTAPYTYLWNNAQTNQTATGLAAGTYTVVVTDANGCSQTQTVIVTSNNPLTLSASSTQTGCTITNGTASASPSNGTAPYSYSWNNNQTTATATGLAAGNYTVVVTDANGCSQTQTVVVTQIAGPTATASASNTSISSGGNSQLTGTGGGNYSWSPSGGLSCTTCAAPLATPAQTTTYCVFVTDANGCTDNACVTITVDIPCLSGSLATLLPNAFSPNNDADNDQFCVPVNACIKTFLLKIYDRWGEKVFETADLSKCWDGIYKGRYLNTDVFAYYFDAVLIDGTSFSQKGNISLVK